MKTSKERTDVRHRYLTMLKIMYDRCRRGDNLGYVGLQKMMHTSAVAPSLLVKMGVLKRVKRGKYRWVSNRTPSPQLANDLLAEIAKYSAKYTITKPKQVEEEVHPKKNHSDSTASVTTTTFAKKRMEKWLSENAGIIRDIVAQELSAEHKKQIEQVKQLGERLDKIIPHVENLVDVDIKLREIDKSIPSRVKEIVSKEVSKLKDSGGKTHKIGIHFGTLIIHK